MDLNFNCKSVNTQANNGRTVTAEISDVEAADILEHFSLSEIIEHFGKDKILNSIGEKECIEYFEIEVKE